MVKGFIGRAVIYVRVSTDEQADNYSIETQIAACQRYAEEHGFTVVAVFQDVMSGAKLERPGFSKVRELISKHAIDALIVYSSDRLTRNLAHSLLLRDELREAGVALHCVTKGVSQDTPEGNLFDSIDSAFAEYERMKINERMERGKRGKALAGKLVGHGALDAPYGYRYAGEKRSELALVEDEAAVVRNVAHWYLDGIRLQEICQRLTNMGLPSPGDTRRMPKAKQRGYGVWGVSTLYRILRNRMYAGTYFAFRYTSDGHRRVSLDNTVPIAVPAILDLDMWVAIQTKLDRGRKESTRNARRFYLLRCCIRCECGYSVTGSTGGGKLARYYRCTGHNTDSVRRCTVPRVKADLLEAKVWEWIDTEVLNEDHIRAAVAERQMGMADVRARLEAERERYYRQLVDLDTQIDRLAQLFAVGLYTLEEIAEHKARLDAGKVSTRQEIDKLDERLNGLAISQDEADELITIIRTVRAKLKSGVTNETKRRVIELLDTAATLCIIDDELYADGVCHLTLDAKRLSILSTGDAACPAQPARR